MRIGRKSHVKTIFTRLVTIFFLLYSALPASAEEFIRSYHSNIDVAKDGTLTVTETIIVNGELDRIRHGIFRDFTLYGLDEDGHRTKAGLDIISVERDDTPEKWHLQYIEDGIRLYVGDPEALPALREHRFRIRYTMDRQIRYFDSHDELTWSVAGDGWRLPMRDVSAAISLPAGAKPTSAIVLTGRGGAAESDARILVEDNKVLLTSTRPFSEGESATVTLTLPKGVLDAPSQSLQRRWWLRDHLPLIISGGGLLLLFVYCFGEELLSWRKSAPRLVVAHSDLPDDLSPAMVNYIDNRGLSRAGWTALSATALDLAMKGFVTIGNLKTGIVIQRTGKNAKESLPREQRTLLALIGAPNDNLIIDKNKGATVQKVREGFRSAVEKEYRGTYFRNNRHHAVGRLFLSIAIIMATVMVGGFEQRDLIFIGGLAIGAGAFAGTTTGIMRRRRNYRFASRIRDIALVGIFAAVGFSLVAATVGRIVFEHTHDDNTLALGAITLIVFINVASVTMLAALTSLGREMMDRIEGLRLYLTATEQDRKEMQSAQPMSPQHFETLLPYAVALGVEKPWSKAFQAWLAAAPLAVATYEPAWYGGDGAFEGQIGEFLSFMTHTLAADVPQSMNSSSSRDGGGDAGDGDGDGGGDGSGGGW